MDFLDLDTDNSFEYSPDSFDVEDILAEFSDSGAERAPLWETDAESIGYDAKVYSPKNTVPTHIEDEDVKLYTAVKEKPVEYIDLREKRAPERDYDEFDERFYMGSRSEKSSLRYGGRDIELEPEEDYVPPKTPNSSAELWPDSYDDYEEDEKGLRGKAKRLLRKYRNIEQMQADDIAAMNAEQDVEIGEEEIPEEELIGDDPFPHSFKEYLGTLATGLVYRFRGARQTTQTVDDTDEDLGKELKSADASSYYGSAAMSLRNRVRVSGVLLAVMLYISLGLPVTGMLNDIRVASILLVADQMLILLLGLDVAANAMQRAVEGRPGADTMALIVCLITTIDAMLVASGNSAAHMPLCALSSLSVFAVMMSSLLNARALRKTLRVPAISKRCYAVTGETDSETGDVTILKSGRPIDGFVRRSEETPPDEELFEKLFIPLAIAIVFFTVLVAAIKKEFSAFIYILSAVAVPAAPIGALLSFALPFFTGAMRIFSSGAAIAGWSGLLDIGKSRSLIVTDRDIFPEGTVELGDMRIFAQFDPDTVVAYAGTLVAASGSCLSKVFADLMDQRGCKIERIDNVQYLPSGGIQAVINGNTVLCGNSDIMRLMNVRVPFRLVNETTVLLAINGILYGIFNITYKADPKVRQALVALMRSNRHPVFAIRDFNITPSMLHNIFDIATDGYDFPTYPDRFRISETEPSESSQIAAVIGREGLGPLSHMADTGRNMYLKVKTGTACTAASAILGTVVTFAKLAGAGCVSVGFMFGWAVLWALPIIVMSYLPE